MNQPPDSSAFSQLLEEDTEELYENAPCAYLSTLPDGTIIKVNATFLEWTGYARTALVGQKRFQALLPVAGKVFYDTHVGPLLIMQGFVRELAFELVCENGQRMPVLLNSVLKRDAAGNPLLIRTTILDARSRRAYEEELRRAKRKAEEAEAAVRQLAEELECRVQQRTQERDRIWRISQDILAVAALDGTFHSFNPAFTRILGWSEEDLPALSALGLVEPDHLPQLRQVLERLSAGDPVERVDLPLRHKASGYRWLSMAIRPEGDALYIVGRDITEERKQAEVVRKMEDALRQAQKMDAIGKLTGGVAHDFNNILQVIAGNLELMRLEFAGDARAGHRLQQARFAVDRGAKLASQLLSFARRQPLQPVPTNLGRVVRELDDLLRRALGASVEIETIVAGGLWTVSLDRNQLENALLNLAVNARDAMNGEGKLTIELGNAVLDENYAQQHPDVDPGQYVMLAVSDTGSGIPPEVAEQIFEPFFTTKPEGKGTGLGLSMVHGFVKQSGGHIKVYSEVGLGTTFRIYLPRVLESEAREPDVRGKPADGGAETILIVEDDQAVQATTVEMLSSLGYKVLKAVDGQSALSILQSGIQIDLLFTDVVMPGPLRSTDLARKAQAILPDIAVLFTSGYTQSAIVHGGRLDAGVELISKPYRREDLARKVRHVLDKAKTAAPKKPGDDVSTPESSRLRILVVEDNPDSQHMLCELLGVLGHSARGVSSAESALDALRSEAFDVLLTDVGLPGKSGVELAREAVEGHPSLRIIFSSGCGGIKEDGLAALCLPKPYNLERVMDVLARSAKQP
ncbi:hybrid sensor histidine kinase/response regulator [Noviherbaspirillum massiliense]|uniref:hybrid sensor histidine kinase/response regulator n=1 Tax=Noviherbaspirillum massiliense TaxID=1465823 RepID=UPI0002F379FB|nr:response regulator [Noviherbaspirillum massiliense]